MSKKFIRNKYPKEMEDYVRKYAKTLTKEQLRKRLEKKYNLPISTHKLTHYLYKRNVRCIDFNVNYTKWERDRHPVGYEYKKEDGMVIVKIGQPNKYEYKQRLMYMKYHNCKLKEDEYIIFRNHDRNDYSIDNLVKVSRKESSYLANYEMYSKDPDVTDTGVLTAKLMIKVKEKKNGFN